MASVQVADIIAGRRLAKDHVHLQEFLDHVLFVFCLFPESDHPLLDALRSKDRPRQGLFVRGLPTWWEPLWRSPDAPHGFEINTPVGSTEDVEDKSDLSPSDLCMRGIKHSITLLLTADAGTGKFVNSEATAILTMMLKLSIEFLVVLSWRIFMVDFSICVG